MENIEIKARIENLADIRRKVIELNSEYVGMDQQIDTYFNSKKGRIKLRESSLSDPYLILYLRPDKSGPKLSVYQKIPVEDPVGVKKMLSEMFGQHVVIIKKREIFLYDNVRIHLDQVENLGEFLEFEAVMDDSFTDKYVEKKKVEYLMEVLGIKKENLLQNSYENMIRTI